MHPGFGKLYHGFLQGNVKPVSLRVASPLPPVPSVLEGALCGFGRIVRKMLASPAHPPRDAWKGALDLVRCHVAGHGIGQGRPVGRMLGHFVTHQFGQV